MPRSRPRIRLVSWNRDLTREHSRALEKAGFTVDASPLENARLIGQFRDKPPAVVLIDLDRLPSHGRAVGFVLRGGKSTRNIPIVFAGGVEVKIKRTRGLVAGAVFSDWPGIAGALKRTLKSPPAPVPQPSYMQQYAGSSLIKKLGFKPNLRVALLGAPEGFEEQLGDLPDGVELETKISGHTKMVIWFVRSFGELALETDYVSARLPERASLWIAYPKQTSRFRVDFKQSDVLAIGRAAGLAFYKICAVDSDWTGLKLARKRS